MDDQPAPEWAKKALKTALSSIAWHRGEDLEIGESVFNDAARQMADDVLGSLEEKQ